MKIVDFTENHMLFNDGSIIECYHFQDCCEHNYADFEAAFNSSDKELKFKSFKVKPKEEGFLVILKGVKGEKNKFNPKGIIKRWVPCYSDQNGYYSRNLTVKVDDKNGVLEYTFDLIAQ